MSKTKQSTARFTDDPPEGQVGEVRRRSSGTGYALVAYDIDFHGERMRFVQVNLPDGTAAYFTRDVDEPTGAGFRAGPFGGGFSWAVPKYVVKAAGQLLEECFAETETETE